MDTTEAFEAERPRLLRIAASVLGDRDQAEDVVQDAWLRLSRTDADIVSVPAWLTTVTTRLCLDRLRARSPEPVDPAEAFQRVPDEDPGADPADQAVLAESVGVALNAVLERLTASERVAFVLHDTFDIDFPTVAEVLDTSPVAARKLASRARTKVTRFAPAETPADWQVVDAFLAAARGGDFGRLLHLLAPDAVVSADALAIATGTPERLVGRQAIASMFEGAAKTAFPVFVAGRPGAAWFLRGTARVAFDFTVRGGKVAGIMFRADPDVLASLVRRKDDVPVTHATDESSSR